MNAKTYGQLLKDALTDDPEIGRLLFVPDETFERCARTVILEFVRRVEERAAVLLINHPHYGSLPPEEVVVECMLKSFDQLSTELKEAK